MKRIPSLDGFRAISIILVVLCHECYSAGFPKNYIDIAAKGAVGVTIFFVISGFLITYLLLVEDAKNGNINVKAFYNRRIFRILPVYFLYVSFILLWRNIENIHISRNDLLHVFSFTVNFDPGISKFLGHFWTLSIEEQFYIFWPAVLIFFRKHLKVILIILISYSSIVRIISLKFGSYDIITLAPFFSSSDAIFIGSLGGIMFFERPNICKHKVFSSYSAQFIAIGIFVLFLFLKGYPSKFAVISVPFSDTFISLSVIFLIFSYLTPSGNLIFKMLNSKMLVHIGVLSYSIYVWQQFFDDGNGNVHVFWRTFPYNILVIYVVSLGSYYLWEMKFLKLRKYLFKQ